jgi:hypothetical protein
LDAGTELERPVHRQGDVGLKRFAKRTAPSQPKTKS